MQVLVRHLVLVSLFGFVWSQQQPAKYAPTYCLRFRFNCQSPEKKGHVCCLYPLPESADSGALVKPATTGGNVGNIVIRPIKLPISMRPSSNDDNNENINYQPERKPHSSTKKNRPGSNQKKSSGTTEAPGSKIRPRICLRLVVNCKSSPDHRCCQYEEETPEEVPQDEVAEEIKEDSSAVVKGEAIPVPLELVQKDHKKYEQIINEDSVASIPDEEPYERIPAECFTESFDCEVDPNHKCCAYLE